MTGELDPALWAEAFRPRPGDVQAEKTELPRMSRGQTERLWGRVSAADRERIAELWGRTPARQEGERQMDLNKLMEIDHVVYVREDGTVTDDREITKGMYAPEISCDYSGPFAEAQISDDQERDMAESAKRDSGWELLSGWSHGGGLYIMHTSEFIGGALADHIRETPGYWVAVSVELHPRETDPEYRNGNGESDTAGWIVAHRDGPAQTTPMVPGTTVHPNGMREWDGGIITNF